MVLTSVVSGGHGATINTHVHMVPTSATSIHGTEIIPPCPANKEGEDVYKAHIIAPSTAGRILPSPAIPAPTPPYLPSSVTGHVDYLVHARITPAIAVTDVP